MLDTRLSAEAPKASEPAVWALGFRPFFLLAGCAGALLLALWLFVFTGYALGTLTPLWHAHEMLYGFGVAVVAGFLLTSTQTWSGRRGIHGKGLMLLTGLWLAGRLAMLGPWPWLAAGIDLTFLPALLAMLWPYLCAASQKRNRVFLVLFGLQILGNLLYHLDMLGITSALARSGIYLAMHVFLLMIMVIAGRVIPVFTRNAVIGARIESWPWLEYTSFVLAAAWLVADLLWPRAEAARWLALAVAASQGLRLLGWHPWQTRHKPILWILPLGYAWLVLGFVLRGLPAAMAPPLSVATHAFTTGAMGVMIYGMMTRVSLGHTGRLIQASRRMVTGYALINLAALLRVGVPWLFPAFYRHGLICAGLLWIVAFAIYVWECAPILLLPRPDGKVG